MQYIQLHIYENLFIGAYWRSFNGKSSQVETPNDSFRLKVSIGFTGGSVVDYESLI